MSNRKQKATVYTKQDPSENLYGPALCLNLSGLGLSNIVDIEWDYSREGDTEPILTIINVLTPTVKKYCHHDLPV